MSEIKFEIQDGFVINVPVPVKLPVDKVLVSRDEYLKYHNELLGWTWDIQDMVRHLKKSRGWITRNILLQPKYSKELDIKNGGFVIYPETTQAYVIGATQMAEWLEIHWKEFPWNTGK
ncbi:MAG: DUF771 domain-containing protein [Bacillota bacterium]|nr:DUF771 domain-containing protein [Bacillota bacterium]